MTPTYAKGTYLFGRGLGLVLLIAFVSWHAQQAGVIGEHGITPALDLLEWHREAGRGWTEVPTLAWFVGADDAALGAMCLVGELLSLLLFFGVLPGPSSLGAALLYLSLHSIGGPFMAFQWDILLVETALLGALVLPWRLWHRPSAVIEPPVFARWAVYALAFRLMFLSGAVKMRSGDTAWSEWRALDYHYWTQPLPNPLSWFVHQLPASVHSASTVMVFVVELVLPFAIVIALIASGVALAIERAGRPPDAMRRVRTWALRLSGLAFLGLMAVIALTGNYGFFNLLTAAIALPLLDDGLFENARLTRLTPKRLRGRLKRAAPRMHRAHRVVRLAQCSLLLFTYYFGFASLFVGLGAGDELPEVVHEDLATARPYRIASGYGLFAVMTRVRREIRIEGSLDGARWREYRFAHKPGDPTQLPGVSAPHMPRLDWQMWFAALGTHRQNPWIRSLMQRLLEAEPSVLALLADDPFDGRRPRFVRARLWDYRFGDFELLREEGAWWQTEALGPYAPTLTRNPRRRR